MGGLVPNREVAAACSQGIWREKRIRTRRRGMSEKSNTSRTSVRRSRRKEKRSGSGRNERKDSWVLAGCLRDLRLSSHVSFTFFSLIPTLFPLLRFFRRVQPGRGIQPFIRNDAPPPSTTHHHHYSSRARGLQARTKGNF